MEEQNPKLPIGSIEQHQPRYPAQLETPTTSNLESQLRELILNNRAGIPDGTRHADSPNSNEQDPNGQGSEVLADAHNRQAGPSPKPARRRLNQAQRRQMSAQLNLSIDPRASSSPIVTQPFRDNSWNQGYGRPPRPAPAPQFQPPGPGFRQLSVNHTFGPPMVQGYSQSHSYSPSFPPPAPSYNPRSHVPPKPHQPWAPRPAPPHIGAGPQPSFRQGSHRPYNSREETFLRQSSCLDSLCMAAVSGVEITKSEIEYKETFRARIEEICRKVVYDYESTKCPDTKFPASTVQLRCFGSLSSGLATRDSDMDLGLVSPLSIPSADTPGSPIPRLIEKALLEEGLGARLLTRTRVPVLKLCENPSESLKQGLLEERAKWEETAVAVPDITDACVQSPNTMPSAGTQKLAREAPSPILCQTDGKTLWAYYGAARALLRKEGGRDINVSTWSEFPMEEYRVLERVSRLFIDGLADPVLKARLNQSPSISPRPNNDTSPVPRSLIGIYTEAEGESIVMACETRVVSEWAPADERSINAMMSHWKEVQYSCTRGLDPVHHTKELQVAVDRMKRMPSVKLALLEQEQNESATQYHRRVSEILVSLRPQGLSTLTQAEGAAVVRHYTAGIRNGAIRGALESSIESLGVPALPLDLVASLHKSHELAQGFEAALDKNLYPDAHYQDIQEYVKFLKGSASNASPDHRICAPCSSDHIKALVGRIAQLTGPHPLTLLQPRDRYKDKLEFPKSGVGVQCDINFSVHLALQNTLLLRCYCHCDPRVRTMILFVKHWAKVRGINSGYRGTLCSYGYALMVLHYLVNIVQPFVCPNLQLLAKRSGAATAGLETPASLHGCNVDFWRDEDEISKLAQNHQLSVNGDSVGMLLCGFFEYYAHPGSMSLLRAKGFDWGRDVLSIRTPGGLLTKDSKGWTGAKTVLEVCQASTMTDAGVDDDRPSETAVDAQPGLRRGTEIKEVRHRYLFAVEDPFELEHNVARTVTHNGIVAIRDEFRRAWRIIRDAGRDGSVGQLLEKASADTNGISATNTDGSVTGSSERNETAAFHQLLHGIHGPDCLNQSNSTIN